MSNFVWTARDRSGSTVVREIPAGSIAESKAILIADGYSDPVLKEDDVMTASQEGFTDKVVVFGEEVKATAADRLKGKPTTTYLHVLRDFLVQDKGLYIPALLVAAGALYLGFPMVCAIVVIAAFVWIAFRAWWVIPQMWFDQLNKAKDWHRWDEVLQLVDKGWRIRAKHPIKVPGVEITRAHAQALVGLGRVEEGLALYSPCENQPGCPSWMYKSMVSGLYYLAKQHHKALEWSLRAAEENPTPVLFIDVAERYLDAKDPVKARAALARLEGQTIVEFAQPFLMRSRGRLAYLEGNNALARQELEEALTMIEAGKHLPFRDGNISMTKGYLACVLARQCDIAGAQRHFGAAEKYLVAAKQTELIEECKRLLGRL